MFPSEPAAYKTWHAAHPAVSLKISKPLAIFASSANNVWVFNKKERAKINKNFLVFINLF